MRIISHRNRQLGGPSKWILVKLFRFYNTLSEVGNYLDAAEFPVSYRYGKDK